MGNIIKYYFCNLKHLIGMTNFIVSPRLWRRAKTRCLSSRSPWPHPTRRWSSSATSSSPWAPYRRAIWRGRGQLSRLSMPRPRRASSKSCRKCPLASGQSWSMSGKEMGENKNKWNKGRFEAYYFSKFGILFHFFLGFVSFKYQFFPWKRPARKRVGK